MDINSYFNDESQQYLRAQHFLDTLQYRLPLLLCRYYDAAMVVDHDKPSNIHLGLFTYLIVLSFLSCDHKLVLKIIKR